PNLIQTEIKPYMMVRIVSLADFIQHYPFAKDNFGPIILNVTDNNLDKNNGKWQISCINGQIQIQKLQSRASTENSITIQQLTRAFFGCTTLANMKSHGQTTLTKKTIHSLDQILIHIQPQFNDYF
ncbi:GNAT family N-acetyltransferase, partial [Lactobacillus sp. XV13L]|nr:GNAT family N-acetyltransferase [Lactobacillus sp. XV13L]